MVLVEVVKLVVDVNRGRNVTIDSELQGALRTLSVYDVGAFVVLLDGSLDLLAHHVQGDAESQEDKAKDAENDHSGAE